MQEATLKGPFKIHGSLLLQQLLQFQKPKHAALGIVSLTPEELKVLCCDPSGSRVIDVFFSSPSVLEKNKDIFLKKMKVPSLAFLNIFYLLCHVSAEFVCGTVNVDNANLNYSAEFVCVEFDYSEH